MKAKSSNVATETNTKRSQIYCLKKKTLASMFLVIMSEYKYKVRIVTTGIHFIIYLTDYSWSWASKIILILYDTELIFKRKRYITKLSLLVKNVLFRILIALITFWIIDVLGAQFFNNYITGQKGNDKNWGHSFLTLFKINVNKVGMISVSMHFKSGGLMQAYAVLCYTGN